MGVEYEQVIERLEKIIENWFDKKELATVLFDCNHGLCKNLTHYEVDGTVDTKEEILFPAIRAWTYYPEIDDAESIFFPVDGPDEYVKDFEHLYSNAKRLHLAVHMLQYLKTNGI